MDYLQPFEQKLVNFNGDEIMTVKASNGRIYAGIKWICDGLGMDARRQKEKLQNHATFSKGVATLTLPSAGGPQETLVIDIDFLPLWLASINPSLVNESVQEKLVEYQLRAKDVLAAAFLTPQYRLPQSYTEALRMLADEVERREQLEQQHQAMLPKAEQFDSFMSAKGAQAMNVVAKSLGTGRTRLFEILRSEGVLMANNTPYQEYLERGYFKVVEKPIRMGDVTFNKPQTLVTPKGVGFISKMLTNRGKVLPLAK